MGGKTAVSLKMEDRKVVVAVKKEAAAGEREGVDKEAVVKGTLPLLWGDSPVLSNDAVFKG